MLEPATMALPAPGSVAVVVQRWHPSIAGGSEHLAWQFARLLAERTPVELLTTTALETRFWKNELPEGVETIEGVRVRRFPVTMGRDACWQQLHELLVRFHFGRKTEPAAAVPEAYFGPPLPESERMIPWSVALQEEWLRRQGPHSVPLLDWLAGPGARYRAILFVTYLYSPAYFGSLRTDPARSLLISTLHDEPPAYLSIFRRMAARFRGILWLTEAERDLSRRLWGDLPGRILPAYIDAEFARAPDTASSEFDVPYLLYSGRIDEGKGLGRLIEYFARFKKEFDRPLALVLTGTVDMKLPRRPDLVVRGYVTEAEKKRLMAGALLFVMPSPLESLSIATLEAMAAGAPVLVNGENPVLREHVRKGDGRVYFDFPGFAAEVNAFLNTPGLRDRVGAQGREYVVRHFTRERVAADLFAEIEAIPPLADGNGPAGAGPAQF